MITVPDELTPEREQEIDERIKSKGLTKEEIEEVLKELAPDFKHIEPHIIILLYTYIKKKQLEKSNSPT